MPMSSTTMASSPILVESYPVNEHVHLLQLNGSSAEVCVPEGQVISWKNNRGEELLFFASKDRDRPLVKFITNTLIQACQLRFFSGGGESIESKTEASETDGGIFICFPKVSNDQQHGGFARTKFWSLDSNPPPPPPTNTMVYIDLIMTPSIEDLEIWPHSYEFRLRIILAAGGELVLISRIKNVDTEPFYFEFAYQNHLKVSDISNVRVEGLETGDYVDNTRNQQQYTDKADALTFDERVNRTYSGIPTEISIWDHGLKKRTFVVHKFGLPDVVIWNSAKKKAKADMLLCVAPAAIEKPIVLKAGEEWKCRQVLYAIESFHNPDI